MIAVMYTYDMHDPYFKVFCIGSGYWHTAGSGKRFDIIADHNATCEQHHGDEYFQTAQEYKGDTYRYTDAEMDVNWKVIVYSKDSMQQHWNQFKGG
jgi:hypothetical protein